MRRAELGFRITSHPPAAPACLDIELGGGGVARALGGLPKGLGCGTPCRAARVGGLGRDRQWLGCHEAASGAVAWPGALLGLPP